MNENISDGEKRNKGLSKATEQELTWARIQCLHFTNATAEAGGVATVRMASSGQVVQPLTGCFISSLSPMKHVKLILFGLDKKIVSVVKKLAQGYLVHGAGLEFCFPEGRERI